MDSNIATVRTVFREFYGEADCERWIAYWRVFFLACAELFNYNGGNEWFVSHYLFSKAW